MLCMCKSALRCMRYDIPHTLLVTSNKTAITTAQSYMLLIESSSWEQGWCRHWCGVSGKT